MGEQPKSLTTEDVLFTIGTPEQRKAAWTLNGVSWAPPMNITDYVARETYLSTQALTGDGRCKYWVVVPRDDPDTIVAACESTRKDVLIWDKERGFRQATGYAIASVFTNPAYRRLGMASFMLRELQRWFDAAEPLGGDAECSALYSDIGREYYASLGWPSFSSWQATLHFEDAKGPFEPVYAGQTRYLGKEETRALCDVDVAGLAGKFKAGFGDSGKTHVAFAPTWEQIHWYYAREESMAQEMFGKQIPHRGAITTSGKSWVYFDHDFRENKIKIMRIVSLHPEDSAVRLQDSIALLEAALVEAREWDMKKVLVWDPDRKFEESLKGIVEAHKGSVGVVFDEREDGSIPSFRWRGGMDTSSTTWEENYYYCWC